MDINVAIAPIKQSNNPKDNLERIIHVIQTTQADIVCFPETVLTGANTEITSEFHPFHRKIAQTTKERNMWCIYGAYTNRHGKIYNEGFIVDHMGNLSYIYQKKHLWSSEKGIQSEKGDNLPITTDFGNIGLIICWDIAFPEETRALAQKGVDLVFCLNYWYSSSQYRTTKIIDMLPQVRAFENQIFFITCDAFSEETASISQVCSPIEIIVRLKKTDKVKICNINLDILKERRKKYNCWKNQ